VCIRQVLLLIVAVCVSVFVAVDTYSAEMTEWYYVEPSYLWVLGAWVFWGTYPAPFKSPSVTKANIDPFVLQCMKSSCVFITSWIVLAWEPFYFTPWGLVGAALWVPAGLFFITSVKLTGVAFATPVANGCQVIVNFCWGAFFFNDTVKNPYFSVLAMFIMFIGMAGISYSVNYEKLKKTPEPAYMIQDGADEIAYDGKDGADEKTPINAADKTSFYYSRAAADPEAPLLSKDLPVPVDRAREKRNFLFGVACAIGCGFFGGTQNVPLRYAPKEAHGASYLISFGTGSVCVIFLFTFIYCIIRHLMKMGPPVVNLKVSLFPGSIAGCLWAAGNVCSIYVTVSPLGQTVGAPLVLCNMMVAGMWGVFYYNEAPRTDMKAFFLASCCVLLGGVGLLAHYG